MLGALSLKWKCRSAAKPRVVRSRSRTSSSVATCMWSGRSSAATSTSSPGYPAGGGQVHDRPRRRGPVPRREHDRRRRRPRHHLHRPHGRHRRDQQAAPGHEERPWPRHPDARRRRQRRLRLALPLPDSKWDFRLEQVRSINVSGHKYGLVYPGIGWLVFREESDLAQDLVFYENYLGKTDATFTLNFSTGAAMVLAQYYNFVRLGRQGYTYVMRQMQQNAQALADGWRERAVRDHRPGSGAAAPGRVPARR